MVKGLVFVALLGACESGQSGTDAPVRDLTIAGSPCDFGAHAVGTTSATCSFTIINPSSIPTGTGTRTQHGSDPTEFTLVADTCNGQKLAPSASCTIQVAFTPTSAGPKSASFDYSANPGGTVSGAVAGTGN